jgi:putative SOS response-associated peptidase YedK
MWDVWTDRAEGEGYTLYTCAILTTSANTLMAPVHDRMPVIVAPEDYAQWLATDTRRMEPVEALLRPFDSARMIAFPVSPRANSASNDGPELIEPV